MAPAAPITSAASDRVKAVRALHGRSGRRKAGRFLVEGPQAVRSALAAGVVVRDLFTDDDAGSAFPDILESADRAGIRVTPTSTAALAAMAETDQPQGVLAVCDLLPEVDLAVAFAAPGPVVVLDAVTDPGNVGTVIRTAAAAGAAVVILAPGCADPHNGKVVRSTAGALFQVPVVTGVEIEEVLRAARREGRTVAVATGDAATDLFSAVSSRQVGSSTCWVIGSEAHGVGPVARSGADLQVRIPMADGPESLNAAVAAAVLLYVAAYGSRS